MKNVLIFALTLCAILFTATAQDDTVQQSQIKVNGACGMCKARIEKAMKIDGVAKSQWNKTTKVLAVSYKPSVITIDSLQHRLALVGHDTEIYKAADSVYAALPPCCHYRTEPTH